MFRLRVFLRSSLSVVNKPMMHEPFGTSSLRAHSTQVRTQMLRADVVVPLPQPAPPQSVCFNCSKKNSRTTTVESKSALEEQKEQQFFEWKPKCILRQPNPTEDLPWDPSDMLSRMTVTPEGKVRWSLGSEGKHSDFTDPKTNLLLFYLFRFSTASH